MKYIVEMFDGRRIRGLRVEKQQMADLLSRLDQIDPALGVVVLDVIPENTWRRQSQASTRRAHPSWPGRKDLEYERFAPVDRMMM